MKTTDKNRNISEGKKTIKRVLYDRINYDVLKIWRRGAGEALCTEVFKRSSWELSGRWRYVTQRLHSCGSYVKVSLSESGFGRLYEIIAAMTEDLHGGDINMETAYFRNLPSYEQLTDVIRAGSGGINYMNSPYK
ncbi:MAG: hypothetical protein ACLUH9_12155 [Waltera sp.]